MLNVPRLLPRGRFAKVDIHQAGVSQREVSFCDRRLGEQGMWSDAIAHDIASLLPHNVTPIDLALVDEEVEELVDLIAATRYVRKLKPSRGEVAKIVTGSLDALCEAGSVDDVTAVSSEDEDGA